MTGMLMKARRKKSIVFQKLLNKVQFDCRSVGATCSVARKFVFAGKQIVFTTFSPHFALISPCNLIHPLNMPHKDSE